MLNVSMPSVLMMSEAGIESLGLYSFGKKVTASKKQK
jgi:hypothetical protein